MNEERINQFLARINGYSEKECLSFMKNVKANRELTSAQQDQLCQAIRKRIVMLGAGELISPTHSLAQRAAMQALAAYEELLRITHGRKVRAQRIRQIIEKRGILPAIANAIENGRTLGLRALQDAGLIEHSFEAVALAFPGEFDDATVAKAAETMRQFKGNSFK